MKTDLIRTFLPALIVALIAAGCSMTDPLTRQKAGVIAESEIDGRDSSRADVVERNRQLRAVADTAVMTVPPRADAGLVSEVNIGQMADGAAAVPARGRGNPVSLDFTDASLKDIIVVFMQDYLKQPYTFQDTFKDRKVNLYFNATATRQEMIELFDTLLDNYGVRMRYAGGVYLIGASDDKAGQGQAGVPRSPSPIGIGDAVGVFRPRFISPPDLQALAKQVMKNPDRVTLLGGNLIINSSSVDVRAVESLMRDVDVPVFTNKHVLVYVPRYLSATSLVAVLDSYQTQLVTGQSRSDKQFEAKQIAESDRVVIVAANSLARDLVVQFLTQADVAGANQRRVFQYSLGTQVATDLLTNLNPLIKTIFRSSATELSIVADKASNSLFLYATPDEFAEIRKLLERMDHRPPAVQVDVIIAEVGLSENMKYGVEWFLKKSGSWLADVTTKLGIVGDLSAAIVAPSGAYAALDLIGSETSVSLLSNPKIVVKNGFPALIHVGREEPVIKQKTNVGTTTNTVVEPEYKKIGLKLEVTPFVNQQNEVRMLIKLEDTSIIGEKPLNAGGAGGADLYPILSSRNINTELVVADGKTVFLGGLRTQKNSDSHPKKIPGLGDLQGIGALFRNKTTDDTGSELIIFATPTVMLDQQGADLVTRALIKAAQREFTNLRPPPVAEAPTESGS